MTEEYVAERRYLCVVCMQNTITESFTVIPCPDGVVSDQCNFDPTQYKNFHVKGGKLFPNRPRPDRFSGIMEGFSGYHNEKQIPYGGICDVCLNSDMVKRLIKFGCLEF